jgi:hypothetical protein
MGRRDGSGYLPENIGPTPHTKKNFNKPRKMPKTYNSGYSLVVTHLTTNPPVRCLNRAERTGSLVFNVLWSYVKELLSFLSYIAHKITVSPYEVIV